VQMMLRHTQDEYQDLAAGEAAMNDKAPTHRARASPILTPRSLLIRLAGICFILIRHPSAPFFYNT